MLLAATLSWVVPVSTLAQDKSGVDVAGMDRSVKPGVDFFAYTNGGWYKGAEIPADRSSLGIFRTSLTRSASETRP